MKKCLLIFVCSFIYTLCFAQKIEQKHHSNVILSVGDEDVTLDEFTSIFYKNNHNDSIITKKYLDEYMELFINYLF